MFYFIRDCLKFAFMKIIQADLDRMKNTWNNHRIRHNKVHTNGIPDYLYYLPQHRGKYFVLQLHDYIFGSLGLSDHSSDCDSADLNVCWQYAWEKPQSNTTQFKTLAEILIAEENLQVPSNAEEALTLYFNLINLVTQ